MPKIYLSPSTQDWNLYINGGTEEYYMNLVADAMEPYLLASGISFVRNPPQMTAASSIAASNNGTYDAHVSLHSNAAPDALSGELQGPDIYYYPTSVKGKRLADLIAENLKAIYPDPNLVDTRATTTIGEVRRTKAPAVLIEFAYHDNEEDANWIKANIEPMARSVVLALTEYFDLPFVEPWPTGRGVVEVSPNSFLYVREKPNISAPVVTLAYSGDEVTIYGEYNGWYSVGIDGELGFANARYIKKL